MRIISWNMDSWKRAETYEDAWRYMVDKVCPDIALLQETIVPDVFKDRTVFHQSYTSRAYPEVPWGTAVYVNKDTFPDFTVESADLTKELLKVNSGLDSDDFTGKTAIAKLNLPDESALYIVSIHTDTSSEKKDYGTGKDRTIMNLEYLFNANRLLEQLEERGNRYVIGGDFNADKEMYSGCYKKLFESFTESGMHECLTPPIQTFYGWYMGKDNHFQDDHLFIPKAMVEPNMKCFAWNYGKIKHLSDHTIVEMEIEI
jgi:exonuclease III